MAAAFVAFTVTAALLVILPGPDTLVVVRNLVHGGRRGGTASAVGVLTGLLVWVAAAFGAIFVALTAIYFAVLVGLAGRVVAWMTDERTRRRLDRAADVVFIGFGVRLVAGD